MRIESVTIENVNSLFGKFEIDFTTQAYSEGLFAIVGPSGAGKSTILDAVCLALYGRTPRITVSDLHDEAMNREADRCSSEVVFVSGEKRYRSTFMHRKTKRSAKPFMSPKNELWEIKQDGSQTNLADKSTEARQKVEKIVGLDYDQFTRSVMLAQFKFAEFLSAKPNERAAILEQVSGTDIYRRISVAVYQKQKNLGAELKEIGIRKEGISVLTKEQQTEVENELKSIDERITGYEELTSSITDSLANIEEAGRLKKALQNFEEKKQAIVKALQERKKSYEEAGKALKSQKEKSTELQKTLVAVRELDYKIEQAVKEMQRLQSEMHNTDKQVLDQKKVILSILKKHLPTANDTELKELYDADNEAQIISEHISRKLKDTEQTQTELTDKKKQLLKGKDEKLWRDELARFEKALPILSAKQMISAANEELTKLRKKLIGLQAVEKQLDKLIKENDEKFLLARLQEKYADERRKLSEGEPCPLCGATNHPSATLEFDVSFVKTAELEKEELNEKRNRVYSEITEINFAVATQVKIISNNEDITKNSETFEDIAETTPEELSEKIDEYKTMLDESRRIDEQISKQGAKVLALTKQLGEVDRDVSDIKHSKSVIRDLQKRKAGFDKERSNADKSRKELADKRRLLFGDKSVNDEEAKQADNLKAAEEQTEKARCALEEAKTAEAANSADIKRTAQQIEECSAKISASFSNVKSNFNSVKNMQADEQDELHKDICMQIDGMGDASEQSTEAMTQLKGSLGTISTQLKERKGEARNKLKTSEDNKKRLKDLEKYEKETSALFKKWNELSGLIGSADGSKFSRIAQGITFDVLLSFANESLSKMSDRYILIRDEGSGASALGINVVDNYQAGDIRPVSNLSGGESFVVSLALALGLSEMSSGRTLIDTLFIDEGFASLDENYLELALQTLSTLGNRQNKLIGVISHVKELKERIDTQIEVSPLSGGRSMLKGPGVSLG